MTIKKCKCLCICEQKLLTNTSQKRNKCSGCFIGNCRGKGLLKTYTGGKFEVTKTGIYQIERNDIAKAYPFSLAEIKDNKEPSVVGEYRIPMEESSDKSFASFSKEECPPKGCGSGGPCGHK